MFLEKLGLKKLFAFSFNSLFVLFLFSYQYKHILSFFEQYDPTIIFGLISFSFLVYFLISKFNEIEFPKEIMAFIIFAIWVMASYSWAKPCKYSFAKFMCFFVYVVPTFFAAAFIISAQMKNFIVNFLTFYIVILSITFITYFQNPSDLPNLFNTNYLVTGQTLGLGTIILATNFTNTANLKHKILNASGIIVSLFLMLHLGGRGPLLSTLIVIIGLCLLHFKNKPKLLFISLVTSIMVILSLFLLAQYFGHQNLPLSLQRIFSAQGAECINLRLEYYQSAWNFLWSYPISGIGIGSWPTYYGLGEIEWHQHPHNIFLEVATETGLIGLSLFIVFLALLVQNIRSELRQSTLYIRILLSCISFSFINALKSGDINDNILFFTFAGLIVGFKQKGRKDLHPYVVKTYVLHVLVHLQLLQA